MPQELLDNQKEVRLTVQKFRECGELSEALGFASWITLCACRGDIKIADLGISLNDIRRKIVSLITENARQIHGEIKNEIQIRELTRLISMGHTETARSLLIAWNTIFDLYREIRKVQLRDDLALLKRRPSTQGALNFLRQLWCWGFGFLELETSEQELRELIKRIPTD